MLAQPQVMDGQEFAAEVVYPSSDSLRATA